MKKLRIIIVLMVALAVLLMPASAFAGSSPYKDISPKKVGKDTYTAICYTRAHWGYIDVVQGQKFKPNKKITRREFCTILGNFYGDENVPVSMKGDVRGGNKIATEKWACKKMVSVSKKLGYEITWNPNKNRKLTRALASWYVWTFATYNAALAPHQ